MKSRRIRTGRFAGEKLQAVWAGGCEARNGLFLWAAPFVDDNDTSLLNVWLFLSAGPEGYSGRALALPVLSINVAPSRHNLVRARPFIATADAEQVAARSGSLWGPSSPTCRLGFVSSTPEVGNVYNCHRGPESNCRKNESH